ncbi:MAG: type 1 glutamine amidotransferase [Bernardetiaceae bacterium]
MTIRLAIFDLYDQFPNKGLASIQDIIARFAQREGLHIAVDVFDVRAKTEVPDLSYDLYIATGGPGSPLDTEGSAWEAAYFKTLDALIAHNQNPNAIPKPIFMICHSFQLFCRQYGFGRVCPRKSESFGIYPTQRMPTSEGEPFLEGLSDPFWIADFRKFQVLDLNQTQLDSWGGKLLCMEKSRPHIDLPPAVMALRFSDWIFGTQFHPEADPEGMIYWFNEEEKKQAIIAEHGQEKYDDMLTHLYDTDKLAMTFETILPAFLRISTQHILQSHDSVRSSSL